MSKHPTPKKKTSKARTRRRYGSFKTKVLNKLSNAVKLVTCPSCGSKCVSHTVCPDCGNIADVRLLINKEDRQDHQIKA